nr:zinc finger, CCHC-type [Tanacetum cinerariifolium]
MSEGKNKEIIVHKEVASFSQFQCPILKSTNYTVWALRIKTILRANGLWDIIEPMDNAQLDIKKDMTATAYLYQALPEDMILQVASCNSTKEIWEALQTRHIGVDRVQKARLQTLKIEFKMLKMKEDDSIDEFSAKLNTIEQITDLEGTTLDEIIGRLKTFEERVSLFNGSPSNNQDKLIVTNHDNSSSHEKGFKNGGQEKFRSYQDNKQDGKTKQFNNEKKPSYKFKRNNFQKGTKDSSKVRCHNCNNSRKRDKGEEIFLNEKEIKPKKYISTDESLWYLDNGASNHMTGIRTHFKEVDEKISRRVRFGDGSYVKIKDRGGEFTSREFTRYCKENGILRQLTAPYSPQQNGIVERRNRSVMSTTRSMLKAMHMPQNFWSKAIRHAVYVLNRVPTKALKDSTPYEALKDGKPNIRYLRVFGCKAYAKVTKPHLKKLDDRSRELVYLGTEPGSKAYRLFNPVSKDMIVSKDVKFKEDEGWDWKGYLDNINPSEPEWRDFIISENQTSSSRIIDEVSTQDSERNDEDSAPSPMLNNTHCDISDDDEIEQPIDNPSTPPPYTYEPNLEYAIGYTSSIESSSRPFDHTPVQGYINLSEIYDRAPKVQSDELLLLEEEPRNYKEAAQDKKWIEVMQIEINSINKNKTWKLATLPDNQKAIARMETVRLILALSAYHGWEVHHLDVKSAFLHGELKEEVYVTQPEVAACQALWLQRLLNALTSWKEEKIPGGGGVVALDFCRGRGQKFMQYMLLITLLCFSNKIPKCNVAMRRMEEIGALFRVRMWSRTSEAASIHFLFAFSCHHYSFKGAWCIFKDQNVDRGGEERRNTQVNTREMTDFNDFINDGKLIGIPMGGEVVALDRKLSDHCPIIQKDVKLDFGPKKFSAFDIWLEDRDIRNMVEDAWKIEVRSRRLYCRLWDKLKNVKFVLKEWSTKRFRAMNEKTEMFKKEPMKWELEVENRTLSEVKKQAWLKARKSWLDKENQLKGMLRRKARIKWDIEGDENYKFFHSALFSERASICLIFCCDRVEKISMDDAFLVVKEFTEEDIVEAVRGCTDDKAPGPDGFLQSELEVFNAHNEKDGVLEINGASGSRVAYDHPQCQYWLLDHQQMSFTWKEGVGVNEGEKRDVARWMRCGVGEFPFTYLGLPVAQRGRLFAVAAAWGGVAAVQQQGGCRTAAIRTGCLFGAAETAAVKGVFYFCLLFNAARCVRLAAIAPEGAFGLGSAAIEGVF